jgi:hypothetical protein
MRSIPLLALVLAACGAGEPARTPQPQPAASTVSSADSARVDSASESDSAVSADTLVTASRTPAGVDAAAPRGHLPTYRPASKPDSATTKDVTDPAIVRGLYVNRWTAQSPRRMRRLIAIADSTEINAFVIDMKDEFGLNFEPTDSLVARNAGNAGHVPNLPALLDTLKAHHILPIARLVTFKDSVTARLNPEHTIRQPDGSPWRDKEGLTWVNPYDRDIWEYNLRVAEEVARLGFKEIQFDYIRFPEPYQSLPPQVFPGADSVPKQRVLGEFFKAACPRLHALGARCTADIFGLVTTVSGALSVGQQWETLSRVADVLLPMVYPSHYPHGAFGISHPDSAPYRVIDEALSKTHERDRRIGVTMAEHVRPWLQAFTLGSPPYGAQELEAQKNAVYDSGYDGWVLWNPGSHYEPFLSALERETVSRKRTGEMVGQ